jgi:hypothetical protein
MPRQAAELLDMIVARAPALIAAGVTSLSIEGLSVTLSKPAPTAGPIGKPTPIARQHIDPLQDASTYPGGKVPGFTRDEDK